MDSQHFLDTFGHIINAPGGIARLRELILQLAISGSLVAKDEKDASVEIDLARARKLRSGYIEAFELRKNLAHPPIDKLPFSIPSHWAWERLESLCLYIQRGKGPTYVDRSSTRVISQKCIQWSGFDLAPARFVSDETAEGYGPERLLRHGDLLWNSTGTGTAGRIAIYDIKEPVAAVADSHVTVVRLANFEPRFVWCVIAAPWIQTRINPNHTAPLVSGTTQQVELATDAVRSLEMPCPPIAEQRRVVAKVDELMALCNHLEKQQAKRRDLQVKARKALIQTVTSASASNELLADWDTLRLHFADLFSWSEDARDMKLLAFRLAMSGVLTEQSESEKLSDELTKSRVAEDDPIADDEQDWRLPEKWSWIRAGWLGEARLGKMLDASKNRGELVHYLRNINVRWRKFDFSNLLQLRLETHELPKVSVSFGDLVICEGGEPGRAAIWERDEPFVIQKALHRFRCGPHVLPQYMLLCLEHDYFTGRLKRYYTGATIKHLTGRSLSRYTIPLPPLAEQSRILMRVESLMTLCATMEDQLRQSRATAGSFAIAAVSSITGITATEQEAELKAPQTELIAPLRIGTPPEGSAQAPLAAILVRQSGKLTARDLWQRFGGEIDGFYAQLKHEVAQGWIVEPAVAEMRERESA